MATGRFTKTMEEWDMVRWCRDPKQKNVTLVYFSNSGQPVARRGIDTKYRTTYNKAYGGLNRLRPFKKTWIKDAWLVVPCYLIIGWETTRCFFSSKAWPPPNTIDCPWSNSILELGSLVKGSLDRSPRDEQNCCFGHGLDFLGLWMMFTSSVKKWKAWKGGT